MEHRLLQRGINQDQPKDIQKFGYKINVERRSEYKKGQKKRGAIYTIERNEETRKRVLKKTERQLIKRRKGFAQRDGPQSLVVPIIGLASFFGVASLLIVSVIVLGDILSSSSMSRTGESAAAQRRQSQHFAFLHLLASRILLASLGELGVGRVLVLVEATEGVNANAITNARALQKEC